MARIALIDASGRAATTVEAVLGHAHEIVVRKRIHAPGDVDLVIADPPFGIDFSGKEHFYNRNSEYVQEGYRDVEGDYGTCGYGK